MIDSKNNDKIIPEKEGGWVGTILDESYRYERISEFLVNWTQNYLIGWAVVDSYEKKRPKTSYMKTHNFKLKINADVKDLKI